MYLKYTVKNLTFHAQSQKVKGMKKSNKQDEIELPPLNPITVKKLIETFEKLLVFYAWYKRGHAVDWEHQPPTQISPFFWKQNSEKIGRKY